MADGKRKTALKIVMAVFITAVLIAFVNLAIEWAYPRPELDQMTYTNETLCIASGSEWLSTAPKPADPDDTVAENNYYYCDTQGYDSDYNRNVFFILAFLGVALVVFGVLTSDLLMQILGVASGFILILEGVMRNLSDKFLVLVALAFVIMVGLYLGVKKLR